MLISVGSGKGGTGKSMVAANLAMDFARQGFRTCLVDLDLGGADAHILFGLLQPKSTLTHFIQGQVNSLYKVMQRLDAFHGLYLVPGTGETLRTSNLPYQTKRKLMRHIRSLEGFDYIFIDVGAGTSFHVLDFFMAADIQIGVTTPDPSSILDFYRFLKLSVIRRLLSAFLSRDQVAKTIAAREFSGLEEILEMADSIRPGAAQEARTALAGLRPHLIFNKVREEPFPGRRRLQLIVKRFLGMELPELGEIPWDRAVEDAVHAFIPVMEYAPRSEAAKALAKVSKRLKSISSST